MLPYLCNCGNVAGGFDAASVILWALYQTIVVKKRLSWSIYIPTHTYDYGPVVVIKRTKSQTQAAKLWLLPGVVGPVVHSHGLRQAANEGTHWSEHQTSDRKCSEQTTGQQNNIHYVALAMLHC